ncbi:MAG: SDR family oxidoreductase [Nanoarchaeota archaeon]|nr:SDR family oxidoreductase [Nanoarchaeota archaeon]
MFELKNKVAVVTGGARGIGQAIAISLAKQGCDVVVGDIINGENTVKKIKSLRRKSMFLMVDTSDGRSIKNMIKETVKSFKRIDILVNNAGIYRAGESENFSEEDWSKIIKVNLSGYFLCCKEAFPYLKRSKGNIVNVASIAGLMGFSQSAAYCASKGGIIMLTKTLAGDWGQYGIRVNAVCPGIIRTAMTTGILSSKQAKRGMLMKLPIKRIGNPEDIANGVVYLVSKEASYVTGTTLVIDGGWTSML